MQENGMAETALGCLVKADVTALRTADWIGFHVFASGGGHVGKIGCTKRIAKSKDQPFHPGDVSHDTAVPFRVRIYGEPDRPWRACYASISSPQGSDVWRTIASLLKVGDILSLDFRGSDNNTYVTRTSETLHVDHFYLRVRRGKNEMVFHVETSVCPDNTARMVRTT